MKTLFGKNFFKNTEQTICKKLDSISSGITVPDAAAYLRVLQCIVNSSEEECSNR